MSAKSRCCCCSENVIPITYGYPSKKAIDEAEAGKRFLGGCVLKKENYHCRNCGQDFKGGKRCE